MKQIGNDAIIEGLRLLRCAMDGDSENLEAALRLMSSSIGQILDNTIDHLLKDQALIKGKFCRVFTDLLPSGTHDLKKYLELLMESDNDFFYVQKSYQLSHANYYVKREMSTWSELRAYFQVILIADYMETLKNRWVEIDQVRHGSKSRKKDNSLKGLSTELRKIKIEFNTAERERHRNAAFHGGALIQGDDLIEKNPIDSKNGYSKRPYEKVEPILNRWRYLLVVIATYMDLLIFKALLDAPKMALESPWKDYIGVYIRGWEAHPAYRKWVISDAPA